MSREEAIQRLAAMLEEQRVHGAEPIAHAIADTIDSRIAAGPAPASPPYTTQSLPAPGPRRELANAIYKVHTAPRGSWPLILELLDKLDAYLAAARAGDERPETATRDAIAQWVRAMAADVNVEAEADLLVNVAAMIQNGEYEPKARREIRESPLFFAKSEAHMATAPSPPSSSSAGEAPEVWCVVDAGVVVATYSTEAHARTWMAQPDREFVHYVPASRLAEAEAESEARARGRENAEQAYQSMRSDRDRLATENVRLKIALDDAQVGAERHAEWEALHAMAHAVQERLGAKTHDAADLLAAIDRLATELAEAKAKLDSESEALSCALGRESLLTEAGLKLKEMLATERSRREAAEKERDDALAALEEEKAQRNNPVWAKLDALAGKLVNVGERIEAQRAPAPNVSPRCHAPMGHGDLRVQCDLPAGHASDTLPGNRTHRHFPGCEWVEEEAPHPRLTPTERAHVAEFAEEGVVEVRTGDGAKRKPCECPVACDVQDPYFCRETPAPSTSAEANAEEGEP